MGTSGIEPGVLCVIWDAPYPGQTRTKIAARRVIFTCPATIFVCIHMVR
jgi:hypothetical protein